MKVNITTKTLEDANFIYDLLVTPTSGCGCLQGEKQCINPLESLPDVMVFDLTEEEIQELNKHEKVKTISRHNNKFKLAYTKKGQTGRPCLAKYNSSNESISHSLHYCQNYKLEYNNSASTNGSSLVSLSSIDCSNVDIVILDTGIDTTHPEFLNDSNVSNIVQFDWTVLKSGNPNTGTQIVATQSTDYYKDTDGHGTACASLAAGKRNGFAKNAKIYSLRSKELDGGTDGFTINECLELMLAFQKAKKLNLHGLNSTRPTVFSNSWGSTGPYLEDTAVGTTTNSRYFAHSIDIGKPSTAYNVHPDSDDVIDSYIRSIVGEGVHVLIAAGNENTYLENNIGNRVHVHYFNDPDTGDWFAIPRTQANNNSYVLGTKYNGLEYGDGGGFGTGWLDSYGSPNIGLSNSKDDYPVIIVGDVIMVGEYGIDSDLYGSGANGKTAHTILKNTTSEDKINTSAYRYNSLSDPFFIKSSYSNFGLDVDIYAPGNGAWAALSNQVATPEGPQITVNGNNLNKHQFFNGTSSATPIVAGILATYLSEFPAKTPKQAREWLVDKNALINSIMENDNNKTVFLPVSSYDGTTTTEVLLPYGPVYNSVRADSKYRLEQGNATLFGTGNIHDVLFCNRFIWSWNRVAQAYPLRSLVVYAKDTTTLNFADTTLTKTTLTNETIETHWLFLDWPNY